MKSGVIEYIKNNAYIEELFLDFINEFKEQYDLLKNKEKKELLKTLNKSDTIMGKISKSYTKDLKVDPKNLLNERKIISRSKEENKEEEKNYGEERDDK